MESFTESNTLSIIVKTAVQVCNYPDMKEEILSVDESCYSENTEDDDDNDSYFIEREYSRKIRKKAKLILKNIDLQEHLKKKVIKMVPLIGLKMFTWAKYQKETFGLSREYTINFLNDSFFTPQGIIDEKKAGEELTKDKSLNVTARYKLACLYCDEDYISDLYKQVKKEEFYDAARPQRIKQPELVKFWSYYLMNNIDRLTGEKRLDLYWLETAIQSGSKIAVEYCLEKTKLIENQNALVKAAVEAVRCRAAMGLKARKQPVLFRNWSYKEDSFIPRDYYVDIMCFLMSKLKEEKKIEFLKKDIEDRANEREYNKHPMSPRVLTYLLHWPFQDYFMKTAELMWEFLPYWDYANLLLCICDRIINASYDYNELLKEFWHRSPERYKKHMFTGEKVDCRRRMDIAEMDSGFLMLYLLLTDIKKFTNEDSENINLILRSATSVDEESIIYPKKWLEVCYQLMEMENWEALNRFTNCLSKEKEVKFKEMFSFRIEVNTICSNFIRKGNWNAIDSFLEWSSLPEIEKHMLKKDIICNLNGKRVLLDAISQDQTVTAVDKFIRGSFSREEDAKQFKKELLDWEKGLSECAQFVRKENLELASEFINFCLSSSAEDVREYKKRIAYRFGTSICEYFILGIESYELRQGYFSSILSGIKNINAIIHRSKFKGCKWEEVEKFLTWCFSSEEEIIAFKKKEFHEGVIAEIHYVLIMRSQWEEARTFFCWLGLSTDEINQLKKDIFFQPLYFLGGYNIFSYVMHARKNSKIFKDYGSRQEAMELLLRWHLNDKETVLKFKDEICNRRLRNKAEKELYKTVELAIKNHLNDLDVEKKGVKRKSGVFPLEKRFRN